MSTLPATGSTISMSTVRNYFGLSGTVSLSQLGNTISPSVTSNIKLSATFGGCKYPSATGGHP
jgi:hypothetical protein